MVFVYKKAWFTMTTPVIRNEITASLRRIIVITDANCHNINSYISL